VKLAKKPQNLSFRGQVYRPRNLLFLNSGTADSSRGSAALWINKYSSPVLARRAGDGGRQFEPVPGLSLHFRITSNSVIPTAAEHRESDDLRSGGTLCFRRGINIQFFDE
jgi:hypothetical protein